MAFSQADLPVNSFVETFEKIISTGGVAGADCAISRTDLFHSPVPEEDLRPLDRLFWLTRIGNAKIAYDRSFPRLNCQPSKPAIRK